MPKRSSSGKAKRTPRLPDDRPPHYFHRDPVLDGRWQKTSEMLALRERLMATNAEEVARLLLEMEDRYEAELDGRDRTIQALQDELRATDQLMRSRDQQLAAQQRVLEEQERKYTAKLNALRVELDTTRSELMGLAQSTKDLVQAHGASKLRLVDKDKEVGAYKRERDALAKELERAREDAKRLAGEAAYSRTQLDEARKDASSLNARLHRTEHENGELECKLQNAGRMDRVATERRVEQLQEQIRALHANNRRLLQVMSQVGAVAAAGRDADVGKALQLFNFVRAVGEGEFQFVGNAALASEAPYSIFSESTVPVNPMVAADLRTATMEHNVATKKHQHTLRTQQRSRSAGRAPGHRDPTMWDPPASSSAEARFVPRGSSTADPIVRMQTEKDMWIPTPAVHWVSQFRARYFANAPTDLFYTLLVELARILRESAGIQPTVSAMRRSAASNKRAAADHLPVTDVVADAYAQDAGQPLPSSRRKANLKTKDVLHDYVALDAVRCVTGLRSLHATIASTGRVDDISEARAVVKTSLATVESLLCRIRRLETETTLEGAADNDAFVRRVSSALDKFQSVLDSQSVIVMGACGKLHSQIDDSMPMLEYLCGGEARLRGTLKKVDGDRDTRVRRVDEAVGPDPSALYEAVAVLKETQSREIEAVHGSMLVLRNEFSEQRGRIGV